MRYRLTYHRRMWWVLGMFVGWTVLGLVAALWLGRAVSREDKQEKEEWDG